ncbi:MAG: hypothetical protein OEZ39_15050 [Gammaproteobacteria bacterium]|nr:hypothetical protein [Gammaproteobacteria bacterium]MDH5653171.1 hypothetical protein [Gammaproteobacteria bacterium]
MTRSIKYLLTFLLFGLSSAVFAEGGGFRFNYNKFNLYLEFNDNVPEKGDEVTGMGYIRDPSGFFYDLISLIQANQETISRSKQHIYIRTDNLNQAIWLKQQEPVSKWFLKLYNLKHFDDKLLLQSTCKALNIKDCTPPDSTYIYVSDIPLDNHKVDLIEFGCFPCSNELRFTLTDRCSSGDTSARKPTFKKVMVTRKTIQQYFQKLVW